MMRVRLAELVEDLGVYPRGCICGVHVADLGLAHDAGAQFPPIIIDAASKRIVDGFHRSRVLKHRLGPDAEIEVEARTYADDRELFLDAARLNSHAIRKLARSDQVRIIILARQFGAGDGEIAAALNVPAERVPQLAVRIAVIETSGEKVPLKEGSKHLGESAGFTITAEQARVIRSSRAVATVRAIKELADGLELGILNLEDVAIAQGFLRLAVLILEKVPTRVEEAA